MNIDSSGRGFEPKDTLHQIGRKTSSILKNREKSTENNVDLSEFISEYDPSLSKENE